MKAKELRQLSEGELLIKEKELVRNFLIFAFSMPQDSWRM